VKASRITGYWFGFYEFQMDMITSVPNGFAAFQCGNPDRVLLIPAKELHGRSDRAHRANPGPPITLLPKLICDTSAHNTEHRWKSAALLCESVMQSASRARSTR
jgi:hypothetical protein